MTSPIQSKPATETDSFVTQGLAKESKKEAFDDTTLLSFTEVEEIEQRIDRASDIIKESKIEEADSHYKEIYKQFSDMKDLDVYERELLRNKLALLFNKIKQAYLD